MNNSLKEYKFKSYSVFRLSEQISQEQQVNKHNHLQSSLRQYNTMITQKSAITIPLQTRFLIFIITLTMVLITLIINALWMNPLYYEGVNIIHSAQTHLNYYPLHIINNFFSMLCHPSTVAIVLISEICLVKHKLKAVIHVSYVLVTVYIIAFLKQAYQQSRPIWSSTLIHKWEWFCPIDFGNPSGHSFMLFPLYQPIISKYIGGFQNFKTGWILLIVFGFLVPFSRTYLGVHSVNQVFFGLTLGLAATVLYRYFIREWFYKLFSIIYKLKKLQHLVIIVLLHLICFCLPFLLFQIYSQNKPVEKNDVNNLNEFCLTSLTSLLIQQFNLVMCTLESFVFGIAYGLFFLSYTKKDLLYFSGRWEYGSWKTVIGHFASMILVCAPIGLIFNIILPNVIQVIFFIYLSHTVGIILIGFAIAFLLPKIQRKYKLIKYQSQESLLKDRKEINNWEDRI